MILPMARVRLLGPKALLPDVLRAVQDAGVLHLASPRPELLLERRPLAPREVRERRFLARALADVDAVLDVLLPHATPPPAEPATLARLVGWARLAQRLRRALTRLDLRRAALEEERALLEKYRPFFGAFADLLSASARTPNLSAFHVLLRAGEAARLEALRRALHDAAGDAVTVYHQPLATGETGVLILATGSASATIEQLLARAQVQEVPLPPSFGSTSLAEAVPRLVARLGELPGELAHLEGERMALRDRWGAELLRARRALRDRVAELDAQASALLSPRAFVIEGWLPAARLEEFAGGIRSRVGEQVVVEELARESWSSAEAPVVLHNPRLFRPFETVLSLMPLPKYGTIDPTPFVGVFFPAFFGLMLGDIGYGLVLLVLALVLRRRGAAGSVLRAVGDIGLACAVCAIGAGFLFGEFLGDLGHHWFGLEPIAFSREEALVPFLLLALALGTVHIVLGLVLGVASARGHPKEQVGRGVSALMIVLIVLALLATAKVLPAAFFTPAVIGILVAFPVLIAMEGLLAPLELLSTLGNILSYARIMALGVASVMLAVVANRMEGAIGSAVVGIVFALLFHLVNFAIGLFSPTIHALRLHYVEFFGKFYSPGGVRYEPFGHWHPAGSPAARKESA